MVNLCFLLQGCYGRPRTKRQGWEEGSASRRHLVWIPSTQVRARKCTSVTAVLGSRNRWLLTAPQLSQTDGALIDKSMREQRHLRLMSGLHTTVRVCPPIHTEMGRGREGGRMKEKERKERARWGRERWGGRDGEGKRVGEGRMKRHLG